MNGKYRVARDGNVVTKALPLERAEARALQFIAKSPHISFTIVDASGNVVKANNTTAYR